MNHDMIQQRLTIAGYYRGPIDGDFAAASRAGFRAMLSDGAVCLVSDDDFASAAAQIGCDISAVRTVHDVLATATPLDSAAGTIIFEAHRFSRMTGGRYDASHPHLSSPAYDPMLYPVDEDRRWQQALAAIALDADAGLMAISFGGFQIIGEQAMTAGSLDPFSYLHNQARKPGHQAFAFASFVIAHGLQDALCNRDWDAFAAGYNPTAAVHADYAARLAADYAARATL